MYYRKALLRHGFDPSDIKPAQKPDEFTLHIGPKELQGSEIGHPMNCAGARACKKQQHATFAWIGACIAVLGFSDGKIIRYRHNGQLPKKHDQGLFALGDYKFTALRADDMPGTRGLRKERAKNRQNRDGKGVRQGIVIHSSLAAQMRRGWEVEASNQT